MPGFGTAFSGLDAGRKLTKEELIRTVRYMIAAEYEAVQIYLQVADSSDDELARRVLKEVADEERIHAGEFLRLLRQLCPDEEKMYSLGYAEVEEIMERLKNGEPVPDGPC